MIKMDETKYFYTKDAAKFLGLSKQTLEKLRVVVGGGPRYRKFGRSVRYTEADLTEWADARTRTCITEEDKDNRRKTC